MNPWIEWTVAVLVVAGVSLSVSLLAPPGERRRGAAFAAAWLLPGAGHALLGKWKKGLFFLAILGATWTAGMGLVGFRAVSFDDNPFYYVGQYGSGLMMLLSRVISPEKAVPRPDDPGWFDPGLLYVCVAGLLNLVVALNVLDLRRPGAPGDAAREEAVDPPAGDAGPVSEKTA